LLTVFSLRLVSVPYTKKATRAAPALDPKGRRVNRLPMRFSYV